MRDFASAMQDVYDFFHDVNTSLINKQGYFTLAGRR